MAVRAWSMMNGQIDYAALNTVVELLGIVDIELLLVELSVIRDFSREYHREDD